MTRLLFLVLTSMTIGCATIVKTEKRSVTFAGPNDMMIKLQTPDGNFEVRGNTSVMMTRTKSDIPIEVTCNGTTNKGVVPTSFDWGWAGLGNVVFGGIPGWVIDGIGNKSYDPPSNYNLSPLCQSKPERATASQK